MTFLQLLLQILTQISSFLNRSISTASSQAGDCHLVIGWHLSWDIQGCKQLFPPTPSSSARCSLFPYQEGQSVPPSEFVANGELVVHGNKTAGSGRHWKALHGVTLLCRQQKAAGRCPSYLISVSLLTSDYFIRFPLSASTPKLIYGEQQNPFPRLLSASLFWLLSLFPFPTERDSLLDA